MLEELAVPGTTQRLGERARALRGQFCQQAAREALLEAYADVEHTAWSVQRNSNNEDNNKNIYHREHRERRAENLNSEDTTREKGTESNNDNSEDNNKNIYHREHREYREHRTENQNSEDTTREKGTESNNDNGEDTGPAHTHTHTGVAGAAGTRAATRAEQAA